MAKIHMNGKNSLSKIGAVFTGGPEVQQLRFAVRQQRGLVRVAKKAGKVATRMDKRYEKDGKLIDRITVDQIAVKTGTADRSGMSDLVYMENLGIYTNSFGGRKAVATAIKWENKLLAQRQDALAADKKARENMKNGSSAVGEARREVLDQSPRLGRLRPVVYRAERLGRTAEKLEMSQGMEKAV